MRKPWSRERDRNRVTQPDSSLDGRTLDGVPPPQKSSLRGSHLFLSPPLSNGRAGPDHQLPRCRALKAPGDRAPPRAGNQSGAGWLGIGVSANCPGEWDPVAGLWKQWTKCPLRQLLESQKGPDEALKREKKNATVNGTRVCPFYRWGN